LSVYFEPAEGFMRFAILASALAVSSIASVSSAALYTDAVGDNFDGNAHMDLVSADVSVSGSNITFVIKNNAATFNSPDWGKYLVAIDTNPATGDTGSPVGNPWGRNIRIAGGADAWIGSWVDGSTGAQAWSYGSSWTQNLQITPVVSGNTLTITFPLSALGLTGVNTFNFDVYSGGGNGGDTANDALSISTGQSTGWGDPFLSATPLTFNVPEPTTIAGLGAVSLLALRRRK
jgi:hypothetical protein